MLGEWKDNEASGSREAVNVEKYNKNKTTTTVNTAMNYKNQIKVQ